MFQNSNVMVNEGMIILAPRGISLDRHENSMRLGPTYATLYGKVHIQIYLMAAINIYLIAFVRVSSFPNEYNQI